MLEVNGASVVRNGGADKAPNEHLENDPNLHDFVGFCSRSKLAIYLIAAPLYAQNHSLRDLERHLKIPKTTIREALKEYSFELRQTIPSIENCHPRRPSSTIPFGYCWKENKLQKDKKEFPTVQEILKLRQSKKSFRTIAAIMNANGYRTRKNCVWHHESVKTVFERSKKLKV